MAADTTYQPVVQIRQDGNMAVPDGHSIDIESGGSLKLAGTAITATAAEINASVAGVTSTAAELNTVDVSATSAAGTTSVVYRAKVALAAVDTGGGVFSWANPTGAAIIVDEVILDVTTVATGVCTLDVGTTAVGATTSSDNLIDGVDVNAATGLFSNEANGGTNGKLHQKLAAGKWVTASKASGATAGIVGSATILYHLA